MTILEHVKNYLCTCPALANTRVDIDCLASQPDSFSLDSVPGEAFVSRYCSGASVRRALFALSSRVYYGTDLAQQAENISFFEELQLWLDRQELRCNLPFLGSLRTARSLSVTSSAYPMIVDEEAGTARYQIQFQLIYVQEV